MIWTYYFANEFFLLSAVTQREGGTRVGKLNECTISVRQIWLPALPVNVFNVETGLSLAPQEISIGSFVCR